MKIFLVATTPGYDHARRLTGSDGLPAPDIAVDIRQYWKIKNEAAKCHKSQLDILKRFFIVYDEKDENEHLNAFSKEYYRVISR